MLPGPRHGLRYLAAASRTGYDSQIGDADDDLKIRADNVKVRRPVIVRIRSYRNPAKSLKRRHRAAIEMECTLCTSRRRARGGSYRYD